MSLSRRRTIWSIVAISAVVLAAWGWQEFYYAGRAEMGRAVDQWRQWGGAMSIAEMTPEAVAAGDNAAPLFHEAFRIVGAADPRVWRPLDDPWQSAELTTLVERFEQQLAQTQQAAAMERCVWPIIYDDGDQAVRAHLSPALVVSRLLIAQAIVRAEAEDYEGASAALTTGIQMGEMLRRDPSFVAAAYQRDIEASMLDASRRLFRTRAVRMDAIAATLSRRDYRADLARAMIAEGALWLDAMDPRAEAATPLGLRFTTRGARIGTTMYLNSLREHADFFRQPRYQATTAPLIHEPPVWATLLRTLGRTRHQFTASLATYEVRAALAMTAIRLRAHRDAHGAYPQTLAELGRVPIDPWDGQPLGYERKESGFMVWSVAPSPEDQKRTSWEWE